MKILLASVIGALLVPSIAISQTHCAKDEVDYFSCATSVSNKVVSVCGNTAVGFGEDISDNSWIQYRFGRIGHIELTYPKDKQGSIKKFEGNHFSKYLAASLSFINEDALFIVGDGEKWSGLEVSLSNGKRITMRCRPFSGEPPAQADRPRQGSFRLIALELTDPNKTVSLQDQFVNQYLKKK